MCNLFDIDLRNIDAYAHSRKECSEKEPFYEHCERTLKYYERINELFDLRSFIARLLGDIDPKLDVSRILSLLREVVKFHDVGKLTDRFQGKLDGAHISESHSDKGFFILTYNFLCMSKRKLISGKEFLLLLVMLYVVYKHHGKLNNLLEDLAAVRFDSAKEKVNEIFSYLQITPDRSLLELMKIDQFWERWQTADVRNLVRQLSNDSLSLFILVKLFYSTLTTADYYATLEYMESTDFSLEVINNTIFKQIWNRFHYGEKLGDFVNFNVGINRKRDKLKAESFDEIALGKFSDRHDALNELRSKINVEAEDQLESILNNEKDSHVYLLNVPTGGGKTNLSLRLALKVMEKRNIRKMFYVFPFINIIEQSFNGLKEYIGSENMDRLDSRYVDFKENDDIDPKTIYANYINNLFFNKPVLFLSHVKFFDLIFRNDKNSNYNFFQLANSVVIIDEIQAYDDKVWTEVSEVLNSIGKFLNTHFVVMSATLPQLQQLIKEGRFVPVLSADLVRQLFKHNLFKRTQVVPNRKIKKDQLAKEIIDLPARNGNNKVLAVTNTIADSYDLYTKLAKEKSRKLKEYDIFLLNSTIVEARRKYIIEECRKDKKMILVATQSVEAGVDIDFNIGFRAYAPLDSIVQVSGRVNRNNGKEICSLIVFQDEMASKVYSSNTKSQIFKEIQEEFFMKEKFDEYSEMTDFYQKVIDKIREDNETAYLRSSRENVIDMQNLFFSNINEGVHLIRGDTISLFIPYDKVAEKLWGSYKQLFDGTGGIEKIAEIKLFRKKLIPYIVNIFNSYTKSGRLKNVLQSEIRYGYYYCNDWKEYFEYESGIDVKKFKEKVAGNQAVFL